MDIDGNGPPTPRANPTLTTAADSCCWTLPPRGRALGSDPSPSSIPLEGKGASLRQRPKPSLIDPRLSICDVAGLPQGVKATYALLCPLGDREVHNQVNF